MMEAVVSKLGTTAAFHLLNTKYVSKSLERECGSFALLVLC